MGISKLIKFPVIYDPDSGWIIDSGDRDVCEVFLAGFTEGYNKDETDYIGEFIAQAINEKAAKYAK